MDDNVMNFMAHRAKTTAAVSEDGIDVDAWLAKAGLDRAGVEAEFASLGVNEEKQAPDVAHCRKMLKGHRELLTLLREMAARAQADFARAIEVERGLEDQIIVEKTLHLARLASGETNKVTD
jgi:hypothetical protein